jgi:hypothetical protein
MHQIIRSFMTIGFTIMALSASTAAVASEEFIYRYKMSASSTAGVPSDPGGGLPGVDPGDNGNDDGNEDGPGDEPNPVPCVDDPECFTDYEGETRYVDPVIAPVRKVFWGTVVQDDGWFRHNWEDNVYSDVDYWPSTRLTIKESNLPPGLSPSGFGLGESYETLYGGVEGFAVVKGNFRIVYNIEVENEVGAMEKVSELVVRVDVVGAPEHIVAPTERVLVGDAVASQWFSDNYGSLMSGVHVIELESGDAPLGTIADPNLGAFVGTVQEEGNFTATFAIRPRLYDEQTGTETLGPKLSTLTISLEASPNTSQAMLVALPDSNESGFYRMTDERVTRWDPRSDLDEYLRYRRDEFRDELVTGGTILNYEPSMCPGGVTWSLDATGGTPPGMTLVEVDDGMALLDYKIENTPSGEGYDYSEVKKRYDYVRTVAVCRDGAGDPMVTYRSPSFTIITAAPS